MFSPAICASLKFNYDARLTIIHIYIFKKKHKKNTRVMRATVLHNIIVSDVNINRRKCVGKYIIVNITPLLAPFILTLYNNNNNNIRHEHLTTTCFILYLREKYTRKIQALLIS